MLVVQNKFFRPFSGRGKPSKDTIAIARTLEGGDVALFIPYTQSTYGDIDSEGEDDDEMTDDDDMSGRVVKSISGQPWVPIFNDRLTMFIGGIPGAGKSYLAKQMIGLLPDDLDILLFTALEEKDGNFEELDKAKRLTKIKMSPEVLSSINLTEIRKRTKANQVVLIFDDIDQMADAKIASMTLHIMNDALANGRGHEKHDGKGDVHVICTTHTVNNYIKTKYMFENSNYIALFPTSTPVKQMETMFEKIGLDKVLCRRIIRVCRRKSIRSIIIHKTVPMYLIFGDKIMLL